MGVGGMGVGGIGGAVFRIAAEKFPGEVGRIHMVGVMMGGSGPPILVRHGLRLLFRSPRRQTAATGPWGGTSFQKINLAYRTKK
jgi:hypothetical protein